MKQWQLAKIDLENAYQFILYFSIKRILFYNYVEELGYSSRL